MSLWHWSLCLNYWQTALCAVISYLAFPLFFSDQVLLVLLDSWSGIGEWIGTWNQNFCLGKKNHSRRIKWPCAYLDLNVADFGCRANDGPSNKGRENVLWEVGACIATLDKLKRETERKKTKNKAKQNWWGNAFEYMRSTVWPSKMRSQSLLPLVSI